MKLLITGSSGTIGTRLFERLAGHHELVGIDKRHNSWFTGIDQQTIIADLRDSVQVKDLPADADMIIHLAANARVYELVKQPQLALDNMIINFNVFEFARQKGIKKIIFASSRETYGNIVGQHTVKEDLMRIENGESAYAVSKSSGEGMLHAYHNSYGIDFVILRFSNVYGMYDNSDRVIPLWFRQCFKNEDLTVFGRDKILDFTYIDDTITGILGVIKLFDEVKGQAFNISRGEGVSLLYVARKLKELTGSGNNIVIKDNRPGEVWKFTADITKAWQLLGYKPRVLIDNGLLKTTQWYKDHQGDNR